MRTLILILTVLFVACNNVTTSKNNDYKGDSSQSYPKIIDSLKLFKQYDSSKLTVYLWSCEHKFDPKSDSSITKTFGELDLVFDTVLFKSDNTEFYFNYLFKGEKVYSFSLRNFRTLVTGVAINKQGKRLYGISPDGYTTSFSGNSLYNQIENPLQPEVIKYIKENKNKLNPWFKAEAIRRGLITAD